MNKHVILLVVLILSMLSCNKNHVFNSNKTIEKNGWHKDSIASFSLPVLDSIQPYNLFLITRNTNTFAFSNLYLITELRYPNGKTKTDTLQYLMAKPNGEWLGTGGSSIKESKLWYLQNFQFKENAPYTLYIKQAMRENGSVEGLVYLEGITDIGIQIETPTK